MLGETGSARAAARMFSMKSPAGRLIMAGGVCCLKPPGGGGNAGACGGVAVSEYAGTGGGTTEGTGEMLVEESGIMICCLFYLVGMLVSSINAGGLLL